MINIKKYSVLSHYIRDMFLYVREAFYIDNKVVIQLGIKI